MMENLVFTQAKSKLSMKCSLQMKKEIAHSVKVLNSYAEALRNNKGVIAVDGKMIDGPIVVRAQRVVDKARAAGIKVELEEGAEIDVK